MNDGLKVKPSENKKYLKVMNVFNIPCHKSKSKFVASNLFNKFLANRDILKNTKMF